MSQSDPVDEREGMEEDIDTQHEVQMTPENVTQEEAPQTRKSSRERKPTTKMTGYEDEEIVKRERKFYKCYGALKSSVRRARDIVKNETDAETVKVHMRLLESEEQDLIQIHGELRRIRTPIQEVRERIDRANAMVRNTLNTLEEVLGSLNGPFDGENRKELARELLQHDYAKSVYGSHMSTSTKGDERSIASQMIRLEAELAAKAVQAKQNAQIEEQRLKIKQLEEARDVEAIKAQLNVYRMADSDERKSHAFTIESDVKGAAPSSEDVVTPDSPVMPSRNERQFGSTQHSVAPQVFDANSFARALGDSMQLSRLPVPVPRTFSGNPLEFIDFERSFKALIENRGIPPKERLYYLKQYVTGPAKDAIEGFFFGATEEAYDSAWKTLQDRYGHPFKVQQAFRERLNKWPKISSKDAPALQKFADFLKSCNDAVPYVHGLQVLNDCLENQKLLNKLPDWIVARWNRMVTESLEECGRYPTFADFARFVSKEARIANNPISSFGALRGNEVLERGDSNGKESVPKRKGSTFVTKGKEKSNKSSWSPQDKARGRSNGSAQVQFGVQGQSNENSQTKCSLCSATEHHLEACPEFVSKSMADRKEFIRRNQICFGCLRKNHFSKDCRNRHKCEVCGKRHPTVLHEYRPETSNSSADAQSQKPNEGEGSDQVTATSCHVQFDEHGSTSMIVPVWISTEEAPAAEMLTYALLDTQSDSSFILDDVAQTLNMKQQPVRLKLSTMTSSSTIESNIVSNLLVRGMALPTKLKIGKTYTREFIPADRQHIPTRATAEKWTHLQDVAGNIPTLQDCKVGLLLGFNCPRALVPREVVTGTESQPYAIRTDLGWSVVGSADPAAGKDWTSQCHRTVTREMPGLTPNDVQRTLEADFVEGCRGEGTCSRQDMQFLSHLESNISQCKDGRLQVPLPFGCQPKLPSRRRPAAVQLQHLQRKMDRNKTFKEHYLAFRSAIVNGGFAEQANDEAPEGAVKYIPHHGVYHSKKKKLRIVFDCSAKFAETCLTDHLWKGPDLLGALSGVLLRFQKHEVAILCDIEKMFRVEERNRNFLQFLWWEGNSIQRAPVDCRTAMHLFGAAFSPGCANCGLKYLVNQYLEDTAVQAGETPTSSSLSSATSASSEESSDYHRLRKSQ